MKVEFRGLWFFLCSSGVEVAVMVVMTVSLVGRAMEGRPIIYEEGKWELSLQL